jgi:hypothetical protein
VLHAGARSAFARRATRLRIDAQIESAITPRTRAIVAVHLYGQLCDIDAVAAIARNRGLALIEDAAQAVGASIGGRRAGTFGTGAFSFYATKNLQTGEGGMITTDDDGVAERARRSQGERTRYVTEEAGYNYRLTDRGGKLATRSSKLDARNDPPRERRAAKALLAGNDVSSRRANCRGGTTSGTSTRSACAAARGARPATALRDRGIESALLPGADPPPAAVHAPWLRSHLPVGGLAGEVPRCGAPGAGSGDLRRWPRGQRTGDGVGAPLRPPSRYTGRMHETPAPPSSGLAPWGRTTRASTPRSLGVELAAIADTDGARRAGGAWRHARGFHRLSPHARRGAHRPADGRCDARALRSRRR